MTCCLLCFINEKKYGYDTELTEDLWWGKAHGLVNPGRRLGCEDRTPGGPDGPPEEVKVYTECLLTSFGTWLLCPKGSRDRARNMLSTNREQVKQGNIVKLERQTWLLKAGEGHSKKRPAEPSLSKSLASKETPFTLHLDSKATAVLGWLCRFVTDKTDLEKVKGSMSRERKLGSLKATAEAELGRLTGGKGERPRR